MPEISIAGQDNTGCGVFSDSEAALKAYQQIARPFAALAELAAKANEHKEPEPAAVTDWIPRRDFADVAAEAEADLASQSKESAAAADEAPADEWVEIEPEPAIEVANAALSLAGVLDTISDARLSRLIKEQLLKREIEKLGYGRP